MRLRKVQGAKDLISDYPGYISDNQDNSNVDLHSIFDNNNPVHLEIGMGKGQFIYTLAKTNPNINYVGVERFDSVIVRALEKMIDEPLNNLFLIRTDAVDLTKLFSDNSFDRIYLNFSDPWPKDRHAKRRLTHKSFLKMYQRLLKKQKELHFKTDNKLLFESSVMQIMNYPMEIKFITTDLHKSDIKDNIMTEFEEKFSALGNSINKIIAVFKEDSNG
jgi:tRNA (guanine-N7-)-methyltransferase